MILSSLHSPGIFNFLGLSQRLETLLHHQNAACSSSNFWIDYWGNFFRNFWWTFWMMFFGNFGENFSIYLVCLISLGCRKDLKLCCIIKMPLVSMRKIFMCCGHLNENPTSPPQLKHCGYFWLQSSKNQEIFGPSKIVGLIMNHCFWTELSVCHSTLCGLPLAILILWYK